MASSSRSFAFSLAISLCLHLGLLAIRPPQGEADELREFAGRPRPPPLQARLVPALLKNTFEDSTEEQRDPAPTAARHPAKPSPPAPETRGTVVSLKPQAPLLSGAPLKHAREALSEHLFYPPEAIEGGLEGETVLLLVLNAQGDILKAEVASSSGHPILDRAALAAAATIGRIPGFGGKEALLPVRFQLF